MKKIIRLTEADLTRLVKRVIKEQGAIIPGSKEEIKKMALRRLDDFRRKMPSIPSNPPSIETEKNYQKLVSELSKVHPAEGSDRNDEIESWFTPGADGLYLTVFKGGNFSVFADIKFEQLLASIPMRGKNSKRKNDRDVNGTPYTTLYTQYDRENLPQVISVLSQILSYYDEKGGFQ